jgi:hypothetical protein
MVALVLLLVAVPAVYAAVTYQFTITVTESAGNAYTNLPLLFNYNVTGLVTGHYISATGLDTRVMDGTTVLPHMLASDRIATVANVSARTSKGLKFTTGNVALTSFPLIVGVGGYVTTADNAKWEPHDNFSLEVSASVSANTTTIYKKLDALKAGPDSSPTETLTATGIAAGTHVIKVGTTSTGIGPDITLRPNGPGDQTDIPAIFGGSTHWQVMSDQNDSTGVSSDYGLSWWSDLYTISTATIADFTSVTLSADIWATYSLNSMKFVLKMPGHTVWESDIESFGGSAGPGPYSINLATNPITGTPWNPADLTNLQIGIGLANQAVLGVVSAQELSITLNDPSYLPVLNLWVDGVLKDSEIMAAPIPDNSNDWKWYPNPYFNYVKLEAAN